MSIKQLADSIYVVTALSGFISMPFGMVLFLLTGISNILGPYQTLTMVFNFLLFIALLIQASAIDSLRYIKYERIGNTIQVFSIFSAATYTFSILGLLAIHWPDIDIFMACGLILAAYGGVSSLLAGVETRKAIMRDLPGYIR